MDQLLDLITRYGVPLVFLNVLLAQLGVPVPAIPTLILAGALVADGKLALPAIIAAAFVACIVSDAVWFVAGRYFGNKVLRLLCRISISPDSCVMQSEVRFQRWGGSLLAVAKFVPGLATVAPPMAGAMQLGWTSFLFFDGLGALMWIGAAIGAGIVFHAQIGEVFSQLQSMGVIAGALLAALLIGYVLFKYVQRQRFYRSLRMARIRVDELWRLMSAGENPVVVDLRSDIARQLDQRRIPGALLVHMDDITPHIGSLPRDGEIVLYCTCPNEASAAHVAKVLIDRGFTRVRPLLGGMDAWIEAGYKVENIAPVSRAQAVA